MDNLSRRRNPTPKAHRQTANHASFRARSAYRHAATGRPNRVYEVVITDRPVTVNPHAGSGSEIHIYGRGRASLYRDGDLAMEWELDDRMIIGPAPFESQSLERGFRAWTEAMPEEPAEYATVLRRAILVAGGRYQDRDALPVASAQRMPPVCYAFQPERRDSGYQMPNAGRNYEKSNVSMLSHRAEIP